VYAYPVPEGKSGQTVVEGLQKEIELLGAVRAGHFCVDCDIFQSNFQNSINGKLSCHIGKSTYIREDLILTRF
jgi:mediator of RNA polymerase II transcription subunit 20